MISTKLQGGDGNRAAASGCRPRHPCRRPESPAARTRRWRRSRPPSHATGASRCRSCRRRCGGTPPRSRPCAFRTAARAPPGYVPAGEARAAGGDHHVDRRIARPGLDLPRICSDLVGHDGAGREAVARLRQALDQGVPRTVVLGPARSETVRTAIESGMKLRAVSAAMGSSAGASRGLHMAPRAPVVAPRYAAPDGAASARKGFFISRAQGNGLLIDPRRPATALPRPPTIEPPTTRPVPRPGRRTASRAGPDGLGASRWRGPTPFRTAGPGPGCG